jgi:cell division protein FtsA
VAQAEELKRQYGNAVVTSVPQLAEVEVTTPQGAPASLPLRTIAEILEPRARELMYYVKESLRYGGVVDALGAGCVLTGGGAMLPGMLDVVESQLRTPARTGLPVRLPNMPQELNHPSWAVAIGMVLYAHRTSMTRAAEDNNSSLRDKLRAMFAASF